MLQRLNEEWQYHVPLYANRFDNLDDMGKFLEKYNLLKVIQFLKKSCFIVHDKVSCGWSQFSSVPWGQKISTCLSNLPYLLKRNFSIIGYQETVCWLYTLLFEEFLEILWIKVIFWTLTFDRLIMLYVLWNVTWEKYFCCEIWVVFIFQQRL